MVNLLASGAAWQAGKFRTNESVTVTLRRAGSDDAEIVATPAASGVPQEYADSRSLRFETRDWLIKTSDYALGGVAVKPQDGDQIIETVNYVTRTYELRPNGGGACARPMDGQRAMWRCHSKLVAKAVSVTQGTASTGLNAVGSAWQADQQAESASILVTLRRAGYDDVTDVVAVLGNTAIEEEREDGSSLRVDSRDFLIRATDYLIDGEQVEPADGDLIIETVDGTELFYELRPFAGEASARPMDQFRTRWRCHTKQVAEPVTPTVELTNNQLRAILGLLPVPSGSGGMLTDDDVRHVAGLVSLAN